MATTDCTKASLNIRAAAIGFGLAAVLPGMMIFSATHAELGAIWIVIEHHDGWPEHASVLIERTGDVVGVRDLGHDAEVVALGVARALRAAA